MAGMAKLRIHIEAVMLRIMISSSPKKRNNVTATDPLTNQSKSTNPGIIEEIKYIENITGITMK